MSKLVAEACFVFVMTCASLTSLKINRLQILMVGRKATTQSYDYGKNDILCEGSNPGRLCLESSALTARPGSQPNSF